MTTSISYLYCRNALHCIPTAITRMIPATSLSYNYSGIPKSAGTGRLLCCLFWVHLHKTTPPSCTYCPLTAYAPLGTVIRIFTICNEVANTYSTQNIYWLCALLLNCSPCNSTTMANARTAAAAPPVPPKSASKAKKATPALVKYYLVAFNVVSALGWTCILVLTLIHLFNLDGSTPGTTSTSTKTASSTLTRFLSSLPMFKSSGIISGASIESRIPPSLRPMYRRSTSTYARVGTPTAFVQSLALLEVVHVLLGFVRSPLQTTAAQVASRLFLVWGIVEQFEGVRSNPIYTSMILSWSITEVIRYSYYTCALLGYEPHILLYLRYTTFYLLYPTGASSEAFLIYATLPNSSPLPGWQSWLYGMWKPTDYIRALLFAIWWPGLYVMYTYMIAQRRKIFGPSAQSKGAKAN